MACHDKKDLPGRASSRSYSFNENDGDIRLLPGNSPEEKKLLAEKFCRCILLRCSFQGINAKHGGFAVVNVN